MKTSLVLGCRVLIAFSLVNRFLVMNSGTAWATFGTAEYDSSLLARLWHHGGREVIVSLRKKDEFTCPDICVDFNGQ